MYISFFSLDGVYHITLTALNKVEFGGPMALRICHQTPYIIDTTAPVILHIEQAKAIAHVQIRMWESVFVFNLVENTLISDSG